MSSVKYLDEETLIQTVGEYEIHTDELITADSYDEELILKKIMNYDENIKILLIKASIQMAIVGYGNRNYGAIRDGENIILLTDLFTRANIIYSNIQNANLKPDDITPRRLIRIFRYHIQKFIKRTGRPSFLWLKYSNRDINMTQYCFPGAEHLIVDNNTYGYLMLTYKQVDSILNTQFYIRLERVGIARGILVPKIV